MERNKSMKYLWKILWVIGLVMLAIVTFNVEHQLRLMVQSTFNPLPILWLKPVISIILGLYISLILIKKWSFKINPSLLWCVAIPCLLLTFVYPVIVTISNNNPDLYINSLIAMWITKLGSSHILGIAAGLTLVLSFFALPKENPTNGTNE